MSRMITIPEFCLVLLIGPSGSGKSTFAARHFRPTEVISSDRCRGIVADDENDMSATEDAFALVHFIAEKRLNARRLTVIDATNVRKDDRRSLIDLARRYHALVVGFVFNLPETVCKDRNSARPDRQFGRHVIRNQIRSLKRDLRGIQREGIRYVHRFETPEQADAISIEREKLWVDKQEMTGPFDIVGDVHGCADELELLLKKLDYHIESQADGNGKSYSVIPPDGRTAVFLGDLVDRGPRIADTLRLVKSMVDAGTALCVCGNHENKLIRKLKGRNVSLNHGLAETMEQLKAESEEFSTELLSFLDSLISHYVLDGGKLVVAHAGLIEAYHNRSSGKVRSFALYGDTTGESDEFGLPVRHDWAADYAGRARVVYGHTPTPEADWLNGTICIDTGCVFGGKLTALRYPEMELVEVPAARTYAEPAKPLAPALEHRPISGTQLDIAKVIGKRVIATTLYRNVTIREERSATALEVMSRYAVDPRWLVYLPPTMSPPETSSKDGYLEYPDEVWKYFWSEGVENVIAEEKHMGSRAIIVACRDFQTAARRFGMDGSKRGAIFTRTGRAFFNNRENEAAIIDRIADAAEEAGLWEDLSTDWLCMDAEIMPWSVKAQALIEQCYAPVGAAAQAGLTLAAQQLKTAASRGIDLASLSRRTDDRLQCATAFRQAYRNYIWPVDGLKNLRIAPFHLLATEAQVHMDKDHGWHLKTLARLVEAEGDILFATAHRVVNLASAAEVTAATDWWEQLTVTGGEGMVVKPFAFVARGKRGLVQPAVKCRGKEYLRIIYGPDYDTEENLARLRQRSLGQKRSMACREFALGHEALTRFTGRAPLADVHECVFGVMALESEPVDPRL